MIESPPPKHQPHPPLRPHYESLEDKQRFLRDVFDRSAPYYEGIAGWGFFGTGGWYRRRALRDAGLKAGMKVLDVATGTGPTARAIAAVTNSPGDIVCVEPSRGMLLESRKLLPEAAYVQAGADDLPLADESFDFLTMGFALRHVNSLDGTFREYCRVLKRGGKVLVLDVTKPEKAMGIAMWKFYFRDVMPRVTKLFTRSNDASYLMSYYWETMEKMIPPAEVISSLEGAGFKNVTRRLLLGCFSEYEAMKP
jgi:demethylmenaquinone methyltransferase/2-methoxy-6-polyprenyl-1,4-benzoquinol methylase